MSASDTTEAIETDFVGWRVWRPRRGDGEPSSWAATRREENAGVDPTVLANTAGTSIAAPLIAGIVATAAQAAGHPLGNINPTLYAANPAAAGLTDLTSGCNTANAVQGYCARPGPDLVSGVGALHDAPRLVALLSGHPAT